MTEHSFGHGQFCYYCGADYYEEAEYDAPCDEKLRKRPTKEQMAEYYKRQDLEEQITMIAMDVGTGTITIKEAAERVLKLDPAAHDDK